MKRKDKYLVGYLGAGNVVYGNNHRSNCGFYERPMNLVAAKRLLKTMPDPSAVIFKLVPVRKP